MYYEFVCVDCGERTVVTGQVREAIVEAGCVNCGATVERGAFEPIEDPPER